MSPFELAEPRSLAEALALLEPADAGVRAIAGGTALMLMMKAGLLRPRRLVSLQRIEPRYAAIERGPRGGLRIGALARLAAIERSPFVAREAPALARALRGLANVRVRNVATLGGHLAHADPHLDLPPLLAALGARVRACGPAGERAIAVEALASGPFETALAPGELITEVEVPPQEGRRAAYLKCTTRSADDWPALGVAVVVEIEAGLVRDARIVLGAASDVPVRLPAAEALLRGARADPALLRRAGEAAAAEAKLVADEHGSAAYKRELARVYVARALAQALAQT